MSQFEKSSDPVGDMERDYAARTPVSDKCPDCDATRESHPRCVWCGERICEHELEDSLMRADKALVCPLCIDEVTTDIIKKFSPPDRKPIALSRAIALGMSYGGSIVRDDYDGELV